MNLYAYVANDPLNRIDPHGLIMTIPGRVPPPTVGKPGPIKPGPMKPMPAPSLPDLWDKIDPDSIPDIDKPFDPDDLKEERPIPNKPNDLKPPDFNLNECLERCDTAAKWSCRTTCFVIAGIRFATGTGGGGE
jgi:hypothetical protein